MEHSITNLTYLSTHPGSHCLQTWLSAWSCLCIFLSVLTTLYQPIQKCTCSTYGRLWQQALSLVAIANQCRQNPAYVCEIRPKVNFALQKKIMNMFNIATWRTLQSLRTLPGPRPHTAVQWWQRPQLTHSFSEYQLPFQSTGGRLLPRHLGTKQQHNSSANLNW